MPDPAATPDYLAFQRERDLWDYAAYCLGERTGIEVSTPDIGCECWHCQTALIALTPYLPLHTVH